MGSSPASAECLHAILREDALDVVGIVTQPDRPVGRGKVLSPCALAKYAEERGLTEVIKPEKVNDPEPMERIRAWKPDVIAVVAFGQILKKPLLDLPLFGCVNCHFSLLPKYRGAAPVIAALEAGDRMTGVTVMHMGVGLDDGPIMLQSFEPIYPDTTGGALMADLAIAGGVALAKALRLLNSNALPPEVKQDEASATYVKKLKKTDGLIDWDRPVLEIEPYPRLQPMAVLLHVHAGEVPQARHHGTTRHTAREGCEARRGVEGRCARDSRENRQDGSGGALPRHGAAAPRGEAGGFLADGRRVVLPWKAAGSGGNTVFNGVANRT